jgi:WD40 repeat protein
VCSTVNAENILWTKDNSFILVQENKNYDCKLFIYSLSGNLINILEPYKNYPGILKLNISPNGHYITASYCDNNIRLYHYLSFKLCKEIFPDNLIIPTIKNKNKYIFEKTVILVENSKKDEINFEHLFDKKKEIFNIENNFPKKVSINQNNTLSNFSYSFNSQYLAFISIKFPHILLIYDITAFKLSFLIVFENNIIDFIWSPCSLQLVICTENEEKIYFFQPQRAKAFKLPESNNINNNINEKEKTKNEKNLYFSSDGKKILYKNNKYTFFLIEPGNDI